MSQHHEEVKLNPRDRHLEYQPPRAATSVATRTLKAPHAALSVASRCFCYITMQCLCGQTLEELIRMIQVRRLDAWFPVKTMVFPRSFLLHAQWLWFEEV
jgi:hypothetical protein